MCLKETLNKFRILWVMAQKAIPVLRYNLFGPRVSYTAHKFASLFTYKPLVSYVTPFKVQCESFKSTEAAVFPFGGVLTMQKPGLGTARAA